METPKRKRIPEKDGSHSSTDSDKARKGLGKTRPPTMRQLHEKSNKETEETQDVKGISKVKEEKIEREGRPLLT